MQSDAIGVTLTSLRGIFGIILALALGEAYKQVVIDTTGDPSKPSIRWGSIISLVAFLLLLIPFFHGMARFLDYAYQPAVRPVAYGPFLLVDIAAFTLEASAFFAMSRVLHVTQWRRFYTAVVCILVVDTLWGLFTVLARGIDSVWPWLISNCIFVIVFTILLFVLKKTAPVTSALVACAVMFVRTCADYWISWDMYFPK